MKAASLLGSVAKESLSSPRAFEGELTQEAEGSAEASFRSFQSPSDQEQPKVQSAM